MKKNRLFKGFSFCSKQELRRDTQQHTKSKVDWNQFKPIKEQKGFSFGRFFVVCLFDDEDDDDDGTSKSKKKTSEFQN